MSYKIIWSIDAFPENPRSYTQGASCLAALESQSSQKSIQPVYVLSPSQLNLVSDDPLEWIGRYEATAKAALDTLLKKISLPGLEPGKVLLEPRNGNSFTSEALIHFAQDQKAQLIVCSTHARKGLPRFFLGSFAESLMNHSTVPVMIMNMESDVPQKIKKILFPTDLSETSKKAFSKTLAFAKTFGAEIVLLGAVPQPAEIVLQSGVYLLGGNWVPISTFLESESEEMKKTMQEWTHEAQSQGVKASSVIDSGCKSVTDSILNHLKSQQADLIAIAAQSGPIERTLLGSITRQVVRLSSCPVLVFKEN